MAADQAARVVRGRLPLWLCQAGRDGVSIAHDIVACDPVAVVRGDDVGALEQVWQAARDRWTGAPENVPVGIGYLSYDLGRQEGRALDHVWSGLEFRFFDALWVGTSTSGTGQIWAATHEAADALAVRLAADPVALMSGPAVALDALESPAQHVDGIRRVLSYITAGDVYQVNLARRLVARVPHAEATGLALFTRLRVRTPASHGLWFADPSRGTALVGNSPERFLRVDAAGVLQTCPIKGTRPRGLANPDPAIDDLVASTKDRAEHTMIVDLERNDLGRVCQTGTVHVVDLMQVLSLPTVHHLVSTVQGRLRCGVGLDELLRATFPGGSVTGAPKRRAMQIIDELETAPRGPYCGATGWLGAAGDLDLAVAIRTGMIANNELTLWVGGGVVADSDPDAELAETNAKAAAFAAALGSPVI